jgi:hypothetical protein
MSRLFVCQCIFISPFRSSDKRPIFTNTIFSSLVEFSDSPDNHKVKKCKQKLNIVVCCMFRKMDVRGVHQPNLTFRKSCFIAVSD